MKKINQLIIESIKENTDFPSDDLTLETPIYGKDSNLDSLGLVTFIVNLEQKIEDKFE